MNTPSLPQRKLSQDEVFRNLMGGDRLVILRTPQDEPVAAKRNGTASLETVAAALSAFITAGMPTNTVDLLDLTTDQLNEVMALAFTDCDAAPAASPAWSFPGMQFDAIYKGKNCHFYCTRGTYDPTVPAGTTGVGPAWHYFIKLG